MENLNNEINLLKIKIYDNKEEIKKIDIEREEIEKQKEKRENELRGEKIDSYKIYKNSEIRILAYKESRLFALSVLLEEETKHIEEQLKLLITKNEILEEITKDDEKIENITTIKRGKRL